MSEGPAPGRAASPAAAVPIVAKMPAPTIAPIPRSVTFKAPSSRLSERVLSSAAARMSSSDLIWKSPRTEVLRGFNAGDFSGGSLSWGNDECRIENQELAGDANEESGT